MQDTPVNTDQQQTALEHAINVHIDHYHDIEEPENADVLADARETITDEQLIPSDAVSLIWKILMEHNHLAIASDADYNNGVDRKPLIRIVYNIVTFNGDELYETYESYRKQFE